MLGRLQQQHPFWVQISIEIGFALIALLSESGPLISRVEIEMHISIYIYIYIYIHTYTYIYVHVSRIRAEIRPSPSQIIEDLDSLIGWELRVQPGLGQAQFHMNPVEAKMVRLIPSLGLDFEALAVPSRTHLRGK